jgi:16S rRNA (guanine1207-N2)-methyltransferase
MLQSRLLANTVEILSGQQVLFLNSAADPFVPVVAVVPTSLQADRSHAGGIVLAEDNISALNTARQAVARLSSASPFSYSLRHVAFHEYISQEPAATIDVAIINLLYQPGNSWVRYGLQVAAHALKEGGQLYVVGAKDRGILSTAKRMKECFGNVETLAISKGLRVVCSRKETSRVGARPTLSANHDSLSGETPLVIADELMPQVFAEGKLDEGTSLLLAALEVRSSDIALDIGCGAGYLGLAIARQAPAGSVTMVDASLATVAMARRNIEESSLTNIRVLPSDGAQAVLSERFDLVVTNPPFHQGGIQTTEIAERFIREAAQVLRPRGRFYLVANRFLKYEPTLRTCFQQVDEVGGNSRYKVLRGI